MIKFVLLMGILVNPQYISAMRDDKTFGKETCRVYVAQSTTNYSGVDIIHMPEPCRKVISKINGQLQ